MSLLNILQFPDRRLKNIALPIEHFDQTLATLIEDMFETLYEAQAVGLAAIQVNIDKRVMVMDVSHKGNQPRCFINPEIIAKRGSIECDEGCLSFPGVYAKVKRAKEVDLNFFDKHGKPQQLLNADGLLGNCIQHELDHLDGITFFDHLSSLKQGLLRNKLDKIRRRVL